MKTILRKYKDVFVAVYAFFICAGIVTFSLLAYALTCDLSQNINNSIPISSGTTTVFSFTHDGDTYNVLKRRWVNYYDGGLYNRALRDNQSSFVRSVPAISGNFLSAEVYAEEPPGSITLELGYTDEYFLDANFDVVGTDKLIADVTLDIESAWTQINSVQAEAYVDVEIVSDYANGTKSRVCVVKDEDGVISNCGALTKYPYYTIPLNQMAYSVSGTPSSSNTILISVFIYELGAYRCDGGSGDEAIAAADLNYSVTFDTDLD